MFKKAIKSPLLIPTYCCISFIALCYITKRNVRIKKSTDQKEGESLRKTQRTNINKHQHQGKMENPHEQTHNALLSRIINNMVCSGIMF